MQATLDFHIRSMKKFCLVFIFMMCIAPGAVWGGIVEEIDRGDRAVANNDFPTAEEAYGKALEADPENFRVLRSLAEVKVRLEKYREANTLLDRILAMKINNGKMVQVYLDGASEPLEAEMVDENVTPSQTGKTNMRNYLDPVENKPEPHYRFFFFKKGKMELVPRSRARVKYVGVPRIDHEEMLELKGQVTMKLIGASQSKGPAEMVSLQEGCFSMGSDKGAQAEKPVHEVCVSPFQMDKFEVTQQAFQLKMGTNPSRFKEANNPVERVTWWEAKAYCEKLGKRLPTEAEWEYAARGGTASEYYWGDEFDVSKANFCDGECDLNHRIAGSSDGYKHTAPVGMFSKNPFGLHDMTGNVSEWVADWFDENYYMVSPKENPQGAKRDNTRLVSGGENNKAIRGGGWDSSSPRLRSAARKGIWSDYRIEGIGFRCARGP